MAIRVLDDASARPAESCAADPIGIERCSGNCGYGEADPSIIDEPEPTREFWCLACVLPLSGQRPWQGSRRQIVLQGVLDIVVDRHHQLVTINELHHEVAKRVGPFVTEVEVRAAVMSLSDADDRFVKVGRQAAAWSPDGVPPLPPLEGNPESRWSDEEILVAIRDAALYHYPLTAGKYADLVAQGQLSGPSPSRITQRFRSWTIACEAAGVVAGRVMRSDSESRWTDDTLLEIVARYLMDPVSPGSANGFDEWKREHAADGPSTATLYSRFGSWGEAKRRAIFRLKGGASI